METPVLDVSRYRKEYRGKVAVSDLSLAVAPGEICGFIGHNGAGKTTLIRSVVGAQPPTSGTVRVCGRDVWREPVAAKRLMAYVPDNPDVYDFLTGAQYLDLIADVFGVGAEERRRRGVLLVPCARGRGAALRHRGGDPPRRARRPRPDRRGARLGLARGRVPRARGRGERRRPVAPLDPLPRPRRNSHEVR